MSNLTSTRVVKRPATFTRGLTNDTFQTAWGGLTISTATPATVDTGGATPSNRLVIGPIRFPFLEFMFLGDAEVNETSHWRFYGRSKGSSLWLARLICEVKATTANILGNNESADPLLVDERLCDEVTIETDPPADPAVWRVSPSNSIWGAAVRIACQNFIYIECEHGDGTVDSANLLWRAGD